MNWTLELVRMDGSVWQGLPVTPQIEYIMETYPQQAGAHIDLVMKQEARARGAAYATLIRSDEKKTFVEADYWLN